MSRWINPYDRATYEDICKSSAIDMNGDPGVTLQAPAEEQDINIIMQRFGIKDGSRIPRWQDPNAMFGDFSEMPTDPVEATEYLRQGHVAFMSLPATMRARFESGPNLYNWLNDDKNLEEAQRMGLLEVKKTPSVSSSTSSDKQPDLVPPTNSQQEDA